MSQSSYKTTMLEALRKRSFVYLALVAFVFLVLVIRLVNLQLVNRKDYLRQSRMNMEDYVPIEATRGEIYDRNYSSQKRNNAVIVSNRASFNITTVPAGFNNKDERDVAFHNLAILLNLPYEKIAERYSTKNPWERLVLCEDVSFKDIVVIAANQKKFPNIEWRDAPVRVYNYSNMFAHVVGYTDFISQKEYKRLRNEGYKPYHKIGKMGIEDRYDEILRGKDGYIRKIVDVKKRTEGEEIGQPPVSGKNLVLTIDFEIQKAIYDALGDQKGAVIVMKPSSGEILGLVSKPDFDPNMMVSHVNRDLIVKLNSDESFPFMNRVIQSTYPPASTFKLITAISALEEEKWKANWNVYCRGKYTLKGYIDKDFYCYRAHGDQNLYTAIGKSCSTYFYTMGYKIGPTTMMRYANYFGYNDKTGIDIPGEQSGFVPSKEWKLRQTGHPWYDGDTINMSIGQGYLRVTPIEVASFLSCFLNNGVFYQPHLVKEIHSVDNLQVLSKIEPKIVKEIPLKPETIRIVKQGMRYAVTNGTARRLSYLKVPVAGKTGTAQTVSRRKAKETQHAWFLGFAPYSSSSQSEQTVVITVLVEYGVAGATSAVPIAEKVLYKMNKLGYFND